MEKQNGYRCASRQFTFRNPTGFHPSLPFGDTPGPSRVTLSNVRRNLFDLRKRHKNSKQMADKSVQTDPIHDAFSPLQLEELEMKTNLLTENLDIVLKSLEPGLLQNILSARSWENRTTDTTCAGDVDSNAKACPALWSHPKPKNGSLTLSEAGQTEINKQENKHDMVKEKLNQILEYASKIKNVIPTNLQHTSSRTTTENLHMPTGVILTPTTQTEPVDTYVKFLQIIDEAAGFKSKLINNRNKSTGNPKSPRRTRRKISNRTHTVEAKYHKHKPIVKYRTAISDHSSGNHSLEKDSNETLSRRKSTDSDVNEAKVDNTESPGGQIVKPNAESQPHVGSLNHRPLKITKFLSADAIISTSPQEKNFCLKDYVSTLRQVHVRSPATKRIHEFSMRSKTYFDFDDYYERLISLRDK